MQDCHWFYTQWIDCWCKKINVFDFFDQKSRYFIEYFISINLLGLPWKLCGKFSNSLLLEVSINLGCNRESTVSWSNSQDLSVQRSSEIEKNVKIRNNSKNDFLRLFYAR